MIWRLTMSVLLLKWSRHRHPRLSIGVPGLSASACNVTTHRQCVLPTSACAGTITATLTDQWPHGPVFSYWIAIRYRGVDRWQTNPERPESIDPQFQCRQLQRVTLMLPVTLQAYTKEHGIELYGIGVADIRRLNH
jgi:hypothetical protein